MMQKPRACPLDRCKLSTSTTVDLSTSSPASLLNLFPRISIRVLRCLPALELDVQIALGRKSDSRTISALGDLTAVSCPACGGVLSQMKSCPPLRFRCQVGHAFTANALAEEQEDSVDEAIRTALRIIEERMALLEKMAVEAAQAGRTGMVQEFEKRANEFSARIATLKKAAVEAD